MRLEPEDCLKQLEAEHIIIAELLINRGDVTEVTSMHGDSRFHRKARQVARFQEEIEGIKDALQEARAEQRSVREGKLKITMTEISQQLQEKIRDTESSNIFISMKTRIERLEVDIAVVMGERSHDARLDAATMSQKSCSSATATI